MCLIISSFRIIRHIMIIDRISKKMIMIKLNGGIGNQLLQISLYYLFKSKNVSVFLFPKSSLLKSISEFNLNNLNFVSELNKSTMIYNPNKFTILDRILIKLRMFLGPKLLSKFYRGKMFVFHQGRFNRLDKRIFEINYSMLVGTWVHREVFSFSAKYLSINLFANYKLEPNKAFYYNKIVREESVAVHVRRGDYLHLTKQGFYTLSISYYLESIKTINSKLKNVTFYFFSNDIEWCKNNFGYLDNTEFVDHEANNNNNNNSTIDDLYLMMKCKHFIVSNSTYSLWACYFGMTENSVIVGPKKWMKQYYSSTKNIFPIGSILIDG